MWHPVQRVAENQFLDVEITERVARENKEALHIDSGSDGDYIGTWFVDELIRLVKLEQGDHTEAIRQREINRQREANRQYLSRKVS